MVHHDTTDAIRSTSLAITDQPECYVAIAKFVVGIYMVWIVISVLATYLVTVAAGHLSHHFGWIQPQQYIDKSFNLTR